MRVSVVVIRYIHAYITPVAALVILSLHAALLVSPPPFIRRNLSPDPHPAAGQMLVKCWSIAGQMLVSPPLLPPYDGIARRIHTGLVKCWPPGGRPARANGPRAVGRLTAGQAAAQRARGASLETRDPRCKSGVNQV